MSGSVPGDYVGGGHLFRFMSKGENQEQDLANVNVNGDYSSTSEDFCIHPGENEFFEIRKLTGSIKSTGKLSAAGYGDNSALTNGLTIAIQFNGVTIPITPLPVKSNAEWARYGFGVNLLNFGSGADYLSFVWFFEEGGAPLWLDGRRDQKLKLIANDNFSGIVTEHVFLCEGMKHPCSVEI